jgi:hypothetical protein
MVHIPHPRFYGSRTPLVLDLSFAKFALTAFWEVRNTLATLKQPQEYAIW